MSAISMLKGLPTPRGGAVKALAGIGQPVAAREIESTPDPPPSRHHEHVLLAVIAGTGTLAASVVVALVLWSQHRDHVALDGRDGGPALAWLGSEPSRSEGVSSRPTAIPRRERGWSDEALPDGLRKGAERPIYVWRVSRSVELELVYVPPGDFVMGSDEPSAFPEEAPRHTHPLERGYWIGRTAVTWKQFLAFCAATGAESPARPEWATDEQPVVNVDWTDARRFCRWARVTLPTEAEWEKAARGTDGQTCVPGAVSPVGALGMTGSVWQWCEDRFAPGACSEEPTAGDPRIYRLRGGSWRDPAVLCRASNRRSVGASATTDSIGLRVVLRAE